MYRCKTKIIFAVVTVLVLALVVSACGPAEPEDPTDAPPEVEEAAMMELSNQTGIPIEEMEVVEAQWTEWPDACLGLGEPDQECAQVMTPGWQLTVEAGGETYGVRTDDLGILVRIE